MGDTERFVCPGAHRALLGFGSFLCLFKKKKKKKKKGEKGDRRGKRKDVEGENRR